MGRCRALLSYGISVLIFLLINLFSCSQNHDKKSSKQELDFVKTHHKLKESEVAVKPKTKKDNRTEVEPIIPV